MMTYLKFIVALLLININFLWNSVHATPVEEAQQAVQSMYKALQDADSGLFIQVVEIDPAEKLEVELSKVAETIEPGLKAMQGVVKQKGGIVRADISQVKQVDDNTVTMQVQVVFGNGTLEPAEQITVVRKHDGWKVRMMQ